MEKKEYLKQARYLDLCIDSKIKQMETIQALATKATATMSGMPGSPNRNIYKTEEAIVKMVMLENEIKEDIAKLVNLKREILSVINAVDDNELRIILEKRYINYESWSNIAADLCVGEDCIYKLHRKALKKIEIPKTLQ